jgi:hypothetical protein
LEFIFLLFGDFSLIDQGFQGVYHGIAKCFGQVMVCELVTLADWRVLGELLRLWEPQEVLGVHAWRPIISEMENRYS